MSTTFFWRTEHGRTSMYPGSSANLLVYRSVESGDKLIFKLSIST